MIKNSCRDKQRLFAEMQESLSEWKTRTSDYFINFTNPLIEEITVEYLKDYMNLKVIDKDYGRSKDDTPYAYLNKQGTLYFNRAICPQIEEYFPTRRVIFAIDGDTNSIYLREAKQSEIAFIIRYESSYKDESTRIGSVVCSKIAKLAELQPFTRKYIFSLIAENIEGELWYKLNLLTTIEYGKPFRKFENK